MTASGRKTQTARQNCNPMGSAALISLKLCTNRTEREGIRHFEARHEMTDIASRTQDLPEPNVLERKASRYLARRCDGMDRSDHAGEVDRAELSRLRRNAVLWAVASGVVSGAIIGGTEAWIRLGFQGGIEDWAFGTSCPTGRPSMPSSASSR
jgi:hypothetical protein